MKITKGFILAAAVMFVCAAAQAQSMRTITVLQQPIASFDRLYVSGNLTAKSGGSLTTFMGYAQAGDITITTTNTAVLKALTVGQNLTATNLANFSTVEVNDINTTGTAFEVTGTASITKDVTSNILTSSSMGAIATDINRLYVGTYANSDGTKGMLFPAVTKTMYWREMKHKETENASSFNTYYVLTHE
ncbi:hypothetical protein Dip518_000612 [Parelusimicrobium proximum]|uniref:hypothetical protein n=1 Tax=Parelusimicrobium proximum TaxID=3228953 RepID=UPI003D184052